MEPNPRIAAARYCSGYSIPNRCHVDGIAVIGMTSAIAFGLLLAMLDAAA